MNDTASLIQPLDEHNLELLRQTRPPDWRNPDPAPLYDLVVIGGGTAGLVSAVGAAGLGARVALVERALLGGDCLITGCVPSKAVLRSARVVREARAGRTLGVTAQPQVDFGAVMARVRARRATLARHDSATRLASVGIDIFFGDASFATGRTVVVDGRTLTFRRAVIATGSRPSVPAIPGLADVRYLTSDNLFWLIKQPRALVIVGAGAIGCEMAQAFALLGTEVTLLDSATRPLTNDDGEAAAVVHRHLQRDGVRTHLGVTIHNVASTPQGFEVQFDGGKTSADAVLMATGRAPNVEALKLGAAGILSDADGIQVDDRLRTSNPRVYAAGDVCSRYRFTHAADAMARVVVRNALFFGGRRVSRLLIPSCTFTFPEVAHVGMPSGEISSSAMCITIALDDVDRSVVDEEAEGFLKMWHVSGRIVAAAAVAPHAGDIIGHVASVMRTGGRLADLSDTIFPYPTISESLRKAGDAYQRTRLTPAVASMLAGYFKLVRRL